MTGFLMTQGDSYNFQTALEQLRTNFKDDLLQHHRDQKADLAEMREMLGTVASNQAVLGERVTALEVQYKAVSTHADEDGIHCDPDTRAACKQRAVDRKALLKLKAWMIAAGAFLAWVASLAFQALQHFKAE